MNRLVLVFLIILFSNCKSARMDHAGSYKSKDYSKMDMFLKSYLGGQALIVGSSLELNSDKSFEYQTCGNIMTGTWFIKEDALNLNIESNQFRIDSLNGVGSQGIKPVQNGSFKFSIRNNALIHKAHGVVNGDTISTFGKLVRIE